MAARLENISNVIGKLLQRRGPKPADLSFMLGQTYGSLTVRRVYYKEKTRHQHVEATCNLCLSTSFPRASDVLAGKSKTCCESKENYKRHKEAIALEVTTPAQ